MPRRALYVVVSLIFVIVGIVMTVRGRHLLGNAKASLSWPTAYGKIVTSEVTKTTRHTRRTSGRRTTVTYWPSVSYRYDVDGSRYTSDAVSFGDYGSNDPEHARGIVHRYPVGREVMVYYSPEDPQVAVLEPGVSKSSYITLGLGIVFSVTGASLLIGGVVHRRREAEAAVSAHS